MSRGDRDVGVPAQPSADLHDAGDACLRVAMARGSREALAEVYERHSAAVYDVALGIGGARVARKVVQQAFLDLWNEPDDLDATETLRAHLLTQAHARAIDQVHRRTTRRPRAGPTVGRPPGEGNEDRPSIESAGQAWPLLSRLPTDERTAIWMTYFLGYSVRELALRLNQSERTIHKRILDGMRALSRTH